LSTKEDNILQILSDTVELSEVNEFLADERVERALLKLTSMLANPELSPNKAPRHILECQALSAEFAIKATYYAGIGKNEPMAREKKNLYYTLKENFSLLSDALKYLAKAGM